MKVRLLRMNQKGFSAISFIALGVLGILVFVFLNLLIYVADVPDRMITMQVPKYPNATNWSIDVSSGFPDGQPTGTICFNTTDNQDKVLKFYYTELKKRNWNVSEITKVISVPTMNYAFLNFYKLGRKGRIEAPLDMPRKDCKYQIRSEVYTTPKKVTNTITWEEAAKLIKDCQVIEALQTHNLNVELTPNGTGSKVSTVEPRSDEIIQIASEAKKTCDFHIIVYSTE